MATKDKTTNELLGFLKERFELAKTFSTPIHEEARQSLKDYDPEDMDSIYAGGLKGTRYAIKIPYIFATHASIQAAFFDGPFNIMFRGKDDDKRRVVEAAHKYLSEKLNLDEIKDKAAWWFILTGNCSSNATFKSIVREEPVINPETGEPLLDEAGEVVVESLYDYNDPVVKVDEPTNMFYSPESKFSETGSEIPYFFRVAYMSPDSIEKIYKEKVEADTNVDGEGDYYSDSKNKVEDLTKTKVYIYQGTLPSKMKKEVSKLGTWDCDSTYYVIFTKEKILHKEVVGETDTRFGKMYGSPTIFNGFGVAKELRPFQNEISARRSQQMRMADLNAFPKMAVDTTTDVDKDAMLDPRENGVITYTGQPPSYLTPPDMSNNLIVAEQKAREDAQFVSGMMDLSTGSQQSTVKTATGQTIFAEVAERRIRKDKKNFGRFWKELIILLLKLAQDNWDDAKTVDIDDQEVTITGADLEGIDFDRDIEVEIESTNVNKEVLRAQVLEMYGMMKDDQLINKEELILKAFKDGFNEKSPERFINEAINPMATQNPEMMGEGVPEIPTSQEGMLGGNQQI